MGHSSAYGRPPRSRLMRYLPYLGLLLVILLLLDSRRSTREADQTLSRSVEQQQHLRNILWMNMLIQRSLGMAFTAKQVGNPEYLERAKAVADSLETPVSNFGHESDSETSALRPLAQESANEFQAAFREYVAGKRSAQQLSGVADRIGAKLNQIESAEWYHLKEHNERLLGDIKKDHAMLLIILGIFSAYLGLLGWTMSRKEKVEAALLDAEAKMLNSAKISALGEMAGGVAHEINNPLATIDLLASQTREILESDAAPNREAIEMLDKVNSTVKRISNIVQGLRIFSRDGSRDQFVVVPVRTIIESTLSLCQEKFKHNGIGVSVQIESPDPAIECQNVQISQVILNLFNNACDAIMQLPERWVRVHAETLSDGVVLTVTDSGGGIPEEVSGKIFNPFFTTKEIGKGTGLGLSISRGIVEAHGGKIFLDRSSPNTCFVVKLPLPGARVEKKSA